MLVTHEPDSALDQLAHAVIGAAIEVHRHLGPGFTEEVYEKALCIELGLRGIPFERQRSIAVGYKGHDLGAGRLDLLVGGCLVLELESVPALTQVDVAKVLSHLEASGCELALLINFNVSLLRDGVRRLVRSSSSPSPRDPWPRCARAAALAGR